MTRLQKDRDAFLNRQDKVNAEMFYAIEALGRRLERSETLRDRLSDRLDYIESGAEIDEETGKFYLPLTIDPADLPAEFGAPQQQKSGKGAVFTATLSLFVATGALALALMQNPTPGEYVTRAEFARLSAEQQKFQTAFFSRDNIAPARTQKDYEEHGRILAGIAERLERQEYRLTDLAQRQIAVEDAYARVIAELQESRTADFAAAPETPAPAAEVAAKEEKETKDPAPIVTAEKPAEKPAVQETSRIAESTVKETVWLSPETVSAPQTEKPAAAEKTEKPVETVATAPAPKAESKPEPDMMAAAQKAATIETAAGAPSHRITMTTLAQMAPDMALPTELRALENRAFAGEAAAQHDLGALYASGHVMPADYRRAAYWFVKAAESGVANAHYNLGVMYHQGLGLRRDVEQALFWYREAAALEHPEAFYNLGIAYVEGIGTQSDIERGLAYLKRAAGFGIAQAAYNLGVLYESQFAGGGAEDKKRAAEWYALAGELGYAEGTQSARRLGGGTAESAAARAGLDIPADLNAIETAAGNGWQLPPPVSLTEEGSADDNAQYAAARGDSNQLVARIQRALMDMDMLQQSRATGILDGRTEAAIRRFQEDMGQTPDGIPTQTLLDHMLYHNSR
ncbi:MAG: hypothetical protein EA357_01860 [Micavibrio sp.]|nr:MAG: hypothetical protein EA357_01860 [Micavibrio sp.]